MTTWQEEFNDKRLAEGGWYGCDVGDGWQKIIMEADEQLAFIDPDYKIHQVKEKFGTLRFYFGTDKVGIEQQIMLAITYSAERRSSSTCEDCGKYGRYRPQLGWVRTLCNDCYALVPAERKRKDAIEDEPDT